MAKKKVENVVIKDEELVPTTLGVYSNKGKSPVALIIMIIIFLSILVFLPNIQKYYDKYIAGKTDDDIVINNNGNDNNNDDNNSDDESTKFDISSSTVIDRTDYAVSNIVFNSNILSLSITNKKTSELDLDDYYLELYNENDTFVERIKVADEMLAASSSDNYTYTLKSSPTKLVFIKRSKEDYPSVTLNYGNSNEASLVCTQNIEKITYTFNRDELSKIDYLYTTTKAADDNYNAELTNKQQLASKYNSLNGVTSSLSSTYDGYVFNVNINLIDADISVIELDGIYKYKTGPDEVKFKMEAQGFKCN